jgi:SAM-dependent methyltransferase
MNPQAKSSNAEQSDYWNGDAGDNWVQQADGMDLMLHEVGAAMLAEAALKSGECVLDVGCGSGAVTLVAHERVGSTGHATGIDISHQLILNAQRRAAANRSSARFIVSDASTWQGETEFDVIVSRFGLMFFDDPVAAFANLLQLSKPGGRLHFACWCSPKESDLASGLMKATASLFTKPDIPPDPNAPGPYAFANPSRVTSILIDAGWSNVKFERWQGRLPLPGATLRESAEFVANMGALGRLMREQHVAMDRVVAAITPFLEQRKEHNRVALQSAAWLVSAHKKIS